MKICKNCGEKLNDDASVCETCGTAFQSDETIESDFVSDASKDLADANLKNNQIKRSKFKENFIKAMKKRITLRYLIGCLIFFILAIIFFALEIKLFYFEKSIANACIFLEVVWSVCAVLNIALIITSLCLRNKDNKNN